MGRRPPPCGFGAMEPVVRSALIRRSTLDVETAKRLASWRMEPSLFL